ncbi:hypothetical protein [Paraflavitalea speifideaquila]|uniref:hypothetical protein n=1 Tax=Paraflavitalea speifideaquila TaxID=3076558 RepID=UPI0028EB065C|nr:hypothetical protein [Paraflavitalea speifideiaquila]
MLVGMKGNEYAYFNRIEKNRQSNVPVLKHYVKTGNTHRNPMAALLESKMLYNKGVSEEFCDGRYKGWEYRTADGKNVLYLYGKDYPGELAAFGYLGNYGLGYLKTSKGNFFILKYIYEGTRFTITSIEDLENAMASFDPSLFEVYEETALVKSIEATEKREQKLEGDLAKQVEKMSHDNSPCGVKKYELLQYQQEEEQKRKHCNKR